MPSTNSSDPVASVKFESKKHEKLLIQALSQTLEISPLPLDEPRSTLIDRLDQISARMGLSLPEHVRAAAFSRVIDEAVGYGPIQGLIDDPEISEVMVSGPKQVYIERDGELLDAGIAFEDEKHVLRIIDRIIRPLGKRIEPDNPMVDARLPDGSRVNIIIPPVAIDGPTITIRKFLRNKMDVQEFIELGSLTKHMSEFLRACVLARLNIIITGNTSSGKTTLLNILSAYIPDNERIITIEDAAELQLRQKYTVRLETKQTGHDGKGEVNTRDLVRNSLRMRPDRIIVGEVRSGETLDMLQAMNTGHSGSLTTLHANSPRDAISRLETMAMMSGIDLPLQAIRRQIASAINLIVHMSRLEDGTRKATHITEVSGMEGDIVTLSDIFRFERSGVGPNGKILGELRPTRIRPLFTPKLEAAGFKLGGEIYGAGQF